MNISKVKSDSKIMMMQMTKIMVTIMMKRMMMIMMMIMIPNLLVEALIMSIIMICSFYISQNNSNISNKMKKQFNYLKK